MDAPQPTVDLTALDLPTLVQWYIDLRNYKSELKRSI